MKKENLILVCLLSLFLLGSCSPKYGCFYTDAEAVDSKNATESHHQFFSVDAEACKEENI